MHAIFKAFLLNRRWTRRSVRIGVAIVTCLVLIWLLASVLSSRAMGLGARHRAFSFDESFDFAAGTLEDYVAWSERRIVAARGEAVESELLEKLLPFRLEPEAGCPVSATHRYFSGVVLTHDVLDSPYVVRELGAYFQSRCLLVFGLALPGHGSRPGELLRTDHEDWIAAQAFAARELATEVEYLYLGGHGVGGTLAILEAARSTRVSGLVLFAPRLDARLPRWQYLADVVAGWILPGLRWADVVPEYTPFRYESRPWRLEREVNALVNLTHEALQTRAVEVPVFLVATREDAEARTESMLAYMDERAHPLSHTYVYGSEAVTGSRLTFRPSALVDSGYLDLSHNALPLPLYDPEFGQAGRSRDCGHYYRREPDLYQACMGGGSTVRGEITVTNLQRGLLERLQFNPFFADLLPQIDAFLGPAAQPPPFLDF